MQNKGAITLFAILLGLICIYYLSFTWVTRSVEGEAEEFASEYITRPNVLAEAEAASADTVEQREYLDSVFTAVHDSFLITKRTEEVFLGFTYDEAKEKEINLGLDLRGGMNVTLEVSVPEIIRGMANNHTDPAFNAAIENASKLQAKSSQDFVTLFGDQYKAVTNGNGNLAAIFSTKELKEEIPFNATNEEVLRVIREKVDESIETAEKTLRARIDKFGVSSPNIQKLQTSGRILVELPGVKDKERVRKLLQGTANLEFWEVHENSPEMYQSLEKANSIIKDILALSKGKDTSSTVADTAGSINGKTAVTDTSKIAAQDTSKKSLASQLSKKDTGAAPGQLSAADSAAQAAQAQKDNPFFAVFSPAIFRNEQGGFQVVPGSAIGYAQIQDTAKINRWLADKRVRTAFPPKTKFMWGVKEPSGYDKGSPVRELFAIDVTTKDGKAPLSGDIIADASIDYDDTRGGKPGVGMTMTTEASLTWKKLTGANINQSIAIVLDNAVYSAPNVQSEIAGGRSSITGNFTINEATDLVTVLKAGKLPARARIVEETVVGPTLGKEAISSGLISFVIALALILVFMVVYYSKAGLVANVALVCNVFIIMGVLASLGAVLTLPGIAGIVLTIGLSVDANILIFERIREELASGKGLELAIKEGFRGAMSSIIDSNITTLLLGIILFVFGTGPIQGFATTLIIGIISSLFCAIFITRLIFDSMLKRKAAISFSTQATANVLKNVKINWVSKRKKYYMFSAFIVLIGAVFFFKNGGFNLGVDFKGGRTYIVRFDNKQSTEDVRKALDVSFGHAPEVKTYGESNQLKITTSYKVEDVSEAAETEVESKLKEGLDKLGAPYTIEGSNKVSETVSNDIKTKAIWAILFSCLVVFVFIFIRFKKWQYGLGAVVALAHDVLIVLSVFVIFDGILPFSLEIDQHFIAAVLTVMGYSMTDTVVVFDRIREYLTERNKKDLHGEEQRSVINNALNNTLSRTVITSLTLFLVLLAIFVFGGTTIKGFTFALLIGVVIGTYSSICIATPVVIDLDKKKQPQPVLK
jgi:SecD/SecF fusion protein